METYNGYQLDILSPVQVHKLLSAVHLSDGQLTKKLIKLTKFQLKKFN